MSHADVTDIINTVNLYALATDSLRFDLYDRVFTEDATMDYGGGAAWPDLASLKRDFAPAHDGYVATQHITTNHQVVVDGDRATCISYVVGNFIRDLPGGRARMEAGGWYDDHLVRTDDGWRIDRRVCRMVWTDGNPAVMVGGGGNLFSVSKEAAAGAIGHLKALGGG